MGASAQESMPGAAVRPHPGRSNRGPDVAMAEFHGLLPAQPAGFLGLLSETQRRKVYVLLGTFKEVRGLVGAGRLLHRYLKRGPRAAARGRITFEEFVREKTEILRAIQALHQKIHCAAEEVGLKLSRIPRDPCEGERL